MKKALLVISMILLTFIVNGQENKNIHAQKSKMEEFTSKTGVIIKYMDYSLSNLKTNYGAAETKVRRYIRGGEEKYFYQISKEAKYDTKTASIAYEDLLEIIKALKTLKTEVIKDNTFMEYLENKFVTDDGFQVGYYVSKAKVTWYLVLEKYGSGNTIFIKDVARLESSFMSAKQKIEELK